MSKISMLDCTLRDGGWVNNFCFGTQRMKDILRAVESSGIEYVELGYLDAKKGSSGGRTEYSDMEAVRHNLLMEGKKPQVTYLAMIDYGKYPVDDLPVCDGTGIDGIRLCFHKKDADGAIQMGKRILEKGYRLLMQPMVCTRYTDYELESLIVQITEHLKNVSAFYIVDSFGAMCQEDVIKKMCLADRLLPEGVRLGLHTHNNRQMSFQNAEAAVGIGLGRSLIIDGTLSGLGKGAGNLETEAFAKCLNDRFGANYNLSVLNKVSDDIICPMQSEYAWGYREEYALSAKYLLTPSYVKVFFEEYHLEIEEVDKLLALIPDEKKDSFDRNTAEKILDQYMKDKKGRGTI